MPNRARKTCRGKRSSVVWRGPHSAKMFPNHGDEIVPDKNASLDGPAQLASVRLPGGGHAKTVITVLPSRCPRAIIVSTHSKSLAYFSDVLVRFRSTISIRRKKICFRARGDRTAWPTRPRWSTAKPAASPTLCLPQMPIGHRRALTYPPVVWDQPGNG